MDPRPTAGLPLEAVETTAHPPSRTPNLGLPEWTAIGWANTRKGYWRIASGPLNRALPTAYWRDQGLLSLTERYGTLTASR